MSQKFYIVLYSNKSSVCTCALISILRYMTQPMTQDNASMPNLYVNLTVCLIKFGNFLCWHKTKYTRMCDGRKAQSKIVLFHWEE